MSNNLKFFTNVNNFKKWLAVAKECDFRCAYCELDLLEDPQYFQGSQIDHFIPRSCAESNNQVVLACSFCNKVKRNYKFKPGDDPKAIIRQKQMEYLEKYSYHELKKQYRPDKKNGS